MAVGSGTSKKSSDHEVIRGEVSLPTGRKGTPLGVSSPGKIGSPPNCPVCPPLVSRPGPARVGALQGSPVSSGLWPASLRFTRGVFEAPPMKKTLVVGVLHRDLGSDCNG